MTPVARAPNAKAASLRKDEVIRIRVSSEAKALLTRAAALRGQTLAVFMLQSARREAEDTLLDQQTFVLAPEAHDAFLALLDAPAAPSQQLRELMARKRVWED